MRIASNCRAGKFVDATAAAATQTQASPLPSRRAILDLPEDCIRLLPLPPMDRVHLACALSNTPFHAMRHALPYDYVQQAQAWGRPQQQPLPEGTSVSTPWIVSSTDTPNVGMRMAKPSSSSWRVRRLARTRR